MRIQLKWSASRQMWVGHMVSVRQTPISWLGQCKRWLTGSAVETPTRRHAHARASIWQSVK